MASRLTAAQKRIMEYISTETRENGSPPSLREIAEKFSITPAGAFYHLRALERKGSIALEGGKARGIRITDPQYAPRADIMTLPLFRQMPFSDELGVLNASAYLRVSTLLVDRNRKYFSIVMDSNQMENAGIREGDTLIFEATDKAEDNDIVAVSAGAADINEVLVRRLRLSPGRYELIPECDNIGAIICRSCQIHGVLRDLVRKYER